MCTDIVKMCFGIANGQILTVFDSYLPLMAGYYCFMLFFFIFVFVEHLVG